jgi:uncharacterized protein (DUF488 family)
MTQQPLTIWTIGHGTRNGEEFVQMLQEGGIQCLVDVRSYPGSRRNPQFSREQLSALLSSHDIEYQREGESLGGFRKPQANSKHVALRSEGFRGYADYMESASFKAGILALIARAEKSRVVIMCAESVPWRCHRSLISDYLVMREVIVTHLVAPEKTLEHKLNPAAKVSNGELVYDQTVQMQLKV